jgi:hypothetical protein
MDSGIQRQKYFEALAAQRARDMLFVLMARVERVPGGSSGIAFASRIGGTATLCELHGQL